MKVFQIFEGVFTLRIYSKAQRSFERSLTPRRRIFCTTASPPPTTLFPHQHHHHIIITVPSSLSALRQKSPWRILSLLRIPSAPKDRSLAHMIKDGDVACKLVLVMIIMLCPTREPRDGRKTTFLRLPRSSPPPERLNHPPLWGCLRTRDRS